MTLSPASPGACGSVARTETKPCHNTTGTPQQQQQPSYRAIATFMQRYAPRLPRSPHHYIIAPYEYTGVDYTLVLYACRLPVGEAVVDLSALCWSPTPLPVQREHNLAIFCQAAKAVLRQLPEAPAHVLCPAQLRPLPSCLASHIYLQHWLFRLAQRFAPVREHDALRLSVMQRFVQTGEPFLMRCRHGAPNESDDGSRSIKRARVDEDARHSLCDVRSTSTTRNSPIGDMEDARMPNSADRFATGVHAKASVNDTHVVDQSAMNTAARHLVNDRESCCGALRMTASLPFVAVSLCAPYVAQRPAFTPHSPCMDAVVGQATGSGTENVTETKAGVSTSHTNRTMAATAAAARAHVSTRPAKSWLNYDRPWRVGTAETTSSSSSTAATGLSKAQTREMPAARRVGVDEKARECVFASTVRDLHTQFALSNHLVMAAREKLAAARSTIWDQLCAGQNIDFDSCAKQLRDMDDAEGVRGTHTATNKHTLAGTSSSRIK